MSKFDGDPIFEVAVAPDLRGIGMVPFGDRLERRQLATHYGRVKGDELQ
jgi:hypothetical protein